MKVWEPPVKADSIITSVQVDEECVNKFGFKNEDFEVGKPDIEALSLITEGHLIYCGTPSWLAENHPGLVAHVAKLSTIVPSFTEYPFSKVVPGDKRFVRTYWFQRQNS